MNKAFIVLEKVTAVLALFFLPSQLAFHFWPSYAFIFGIRVDYLSPAMYFTDLLVFVLLLCLIKNDAGEFFRFLKSKRLYLVWFFLLAAVNVYFSTSPLISVFKWLKITEALFFGAYFYMRKFFIGENLLFKTVLFSSFLVSLIGIMQFFIGRTTGIFYFLGERTFNISTPGIALVRLQNNIFLRAYSVFSHPNSLSGYLGVGLIFLFAQKDKIKKTKIFHIAYLILAFCFVLSFSLSAFISMTALTIFSFVKFNARVLKNLFLAFLIMSVLLSLLAPISSEQILRVISLPSEISQRLDLSFLSGKMISDRFFFGEGLNTFIVNSVKFSGTQSYIWLLQPVHNIFLLIFSETGILGLLAFVFLAFKVIVFSLKKRLYYFSAVLFFVLFTGSLDHYWLTLQQNLLLLGFISGYFIGNNEALGHS